ncbi:MAG: hypothetical protein HQ546_01610, partial [Planctomycetes bacterium]|nr:hypothetical protein [Planctomycetota bacterium]
MNDIDYTAGARALLEIQAKCMDWGEVLRRNGWRDDDTGTHRTAAVPPEAKAAELAVMSLIKKHEAVLMYCRNNFARDPSSPLDRAFDYIGIWLGRGPETLKYNTVALPECLTIEIAQPNVAERYREPTFVVQVGRWAQKLSELAAKGSDGKQVESNSGNKPKRHGLWSVERTQPEVARYLSEQLVKYNELVPRCLAGDPPAIIQFRDTFGPTAIANAIGDGCKKQNVVKTQTYKDKIKPVLIGRPPKDWRPPARDDSEIARHKDIMRK